MIFLFRFNLKRRKRVIDGDFPKRLNLLWIIGIFFTSFPHDYICSQKMPLYSLIKNILLKMFFENLCWHATNIPFSRFSFLNLIFSEGGVSC